MGASGYYPTRADELIAEAQDSERGEQAKIFRKIPDRH
jgi:hypothetical protein